MNRRSLFALALTLFGTTWAVSAHTDTLNISDAWVREAPPTSAVNAAYMQIANPGAKELAIAGASSPQFESAEIHRTEIVDGMARMLPQKRLAVPAGGSVTLAPKGLHLMLIQAKQPLRVGDHVEIHLQMEDGGDVKIDAEVRAETTGSTTEGVDHSRHQH